MIRVLFELIRFFYGEGRELKIFRSEKKFISVSLVVVKEGYGFNLLLLVKMLEMKMIFFENSFLLKMGLLLMCMN